MDEPCNNCGSESWNEVLVTEYEGHKAMDNRNPTEKTVFECEGCGAEGRRFEDGVDGSVTLSGALRQ